MKKEDISKVISEINDKYIEEAAETVPKKKRTKAFIGIAACIIITVFAGVLISNNGFNSLFPAGTENTTSSLASNTEQSNTLKSTEETVTSPAIEVDTVTVPAEMSIVSKWDDLTISLKYGEVELNDAVYGTQETVMSEENILDFLEKREMSGYDIYEDKTYTVTAEVYSLKNIAKKCAVAVKFPDDDNYYLYVNSWYTPETLGDFIFDLDLKNILVFGEAYIETYEYSDLRTEYTKITYEDFDDSIIWSMLLDDESVKNTEYNHPYDRIGISLDVPMLGYENISFSVTTDGYIITNVLNTQKCFFVGTEKTDAFASYLRENVKSKEDVTVYELASDGSIPGKSDSGQSTPGYDPNENTLSEETTVLENSSVFSADSNHSDTSNAYSPDSIVQISPPYDPTEKTSPPETTQITPAEFPQDFIIEATTQHK